MIQVVWEFVVKEEFRGAFEQAYGPGGEWARLFAEHRGFLGTTLLRDTANPRRYLTMDAWATIADRERMLATAAAQYSALDERFGKWTESEAEVGIFEVPPAPAKRSKLAGGV